MSSSEENNQQLKLHDNDVEGYLTAATPVSESDSDVDDSSDDSQSSSSSRIYEPPDSKTPNLYGSAVPIDRNAYYGSAPAAESWHQYANPYGVQTGFGASNPPFYYHQAGCYGYNASPGFPQYQTPAHQFSNSFTTNHDLYNQSFSNSAADTSVQQYQSFQSSSSFNSSAQLSSNSSMDAKSCTPPPQPFSSLSSSSSMSVSSEHQQPLSVQTYSPSPPPVCAADAGRQHHSTPSLITTISAMNAAGSAGYNNSYSSYVNSGPKAAHQGAYDPYMFGSQNGADQAAAYSNRSYFENYYANNGYNSAFPHSQALFDNKAQVEKSSDLDLSVQSVSSSAVFPSAASSSVNASPFNDFYIYGGNKPESKAEENDSDDDSEDGDNEPEETKPTAKTTASEKRAGPETAADKDQTSQTNAGGAKYKRRTRTTFTKAQLKTLEDTFQSMNYPDIKMVDELTVRLNLTVERVNIWFQNRRARQKKEKKLMSAQNRDKLGTFNLALPMQMLGYGRPPARANAGFLPPNDLHHASSPLSAYGRAPTSRPLPFNAAGFYQDSNPSYLAKKAPAALFQHQHQFSASFESNSSFNSTTGASYSASPASSSSSSLSSSPTVLSTAAAFNLFNSKVNM